MSIEALFGMLVLGVSGAGAPKRALHLSSLRDRVRQAALAHRADLPAPSDLRSLVGTRKMWHRKATDPDFGHVRVATTPEPLSAAAAPGIPVAVSLRSFSRVTVSGRRRDVLDLTRAMLAHLVTFHHPLTLRVICRACPQRAAEWEWLRWLPHAAGTGRILYTVIVLDSPVPSFVDGQRGVTVIDVGGGPAVPATAGLELVVDGERLGKRTAAGVMPIGGTDRLDRARAEVLARRLTSQGGAQWWAPAYR